MSQFNTSANVEALLGGYHAGASTAAQGAGLALSQQHLQLEQQREQMAQAEFARQQAEHESATNAYRGINLDLLDGLPHGTSVAGPRPQQVQPINGMQSDPTAELGQIGMGEQTPMNPPAGIAAPPQAAPTGAPDQGMEPSTIPQADDEDTARLRRMIQSGGIEANKALYEHLQSKKKRANLLRRIDAIRRSGFDKLLSDPKEQALMQAALAAEDPDEAIKALSRQVSIDARMQGMLDVAGLRGTSAQNVANINAGSRENVAGIGAGVGYDRNDVARQGNTIRGQTLGEAIRHHGVAEGQGQQRVDQLGKPHAGAIVNDPVYRQHSDRYKNAMAMAQSADRDSTNGALPKDARDEAISTRRLWLSEASAAHQAMAQRTQELGTAPIGAQPQPQAPAAAAPGPPAPISSPAGPAPSAQQPGNVNRQQAIAAAFAAQHPGVQFNPNDPEHVQALQAIAAQIPPGAQ